MKRKELTKTFMMISNLKNPLVSMVYTKVFHRCKGLFISETVRHLTSYCLLLLCIGAFITEHWDRYT